MRCRKQLLWRGVAISVLLLSLSGRSTVAEVVFEFAHQFEGGPLIHYSTATHEASGALSTFQVATSHGILRGTVTTPNPNKLIAEMSLVGSDDTLVITLRTEYAMPGVAWFMWDHSAFGAVAYVFTDEYVHMYGSTVANCEGIASNELYLALREMTDLFDSQVGTMYDETPVPDALGNMHLLLLGATVMPRLVADCEAYLPSTQNENVCTMAEYLEGCTQCCDDNYTLTGFLCKIRTGIPGMGFLCKQVLKLAKAKCYESCQGLPPAPAPGEGCHSLGCVGVCRIEACPPGEEPGRGVACSAGANCCIPCLCLYGDPTCDMQFPPE